MKVKTLTPKQVRFVEEYLVDNNATQAAIRAGYAERTANEQGSRLLAKSNVQALVEQKRGALAKKTEVSAERVIAEYCKVAFADMANYVMIDQKSGEVRLDFGKIPAGGTAAIAEITQEEYMDGAGDDARPVKRTKFKLYDKLRALDALGKHLGLFIEKQEMTGQLVIRVERVDPPPLADVRKVVVNHAGLNGHAAGLNGHANGNGKPASR